MSDTRPSGPIRSERARRELEQAERWFAADAGQRRVITRALVAALALHATVLVAHMPNWGPAPVRVDKPAEQSMKVQFLKPPPPAKARGTSNWSAKYSPTGTPATR